MARQAVRRAVDLPRLVAIGILTSGSRVLVTRHRPEGPLEGLWEFPGGKVEFGEHPWEALRREVREELGIHIHAGQLFGIYSHVYDFEGGKVHYVLVAYRVRLPGRRVPPTGGRRWVPLAELREWPVVPGSTPIVADLTRRPRRGIHLKISPV